MQGMFMPHSGHDWQIWLASCRHVAILTCRIVSFDSWCAESAKPSYNLPPKPTPKDEKEDQKKKFHRIERSFGNFRRSFTLPEDTDSKKVTAEFRDGVLKVHLPTTTIAKTKSIEVKVQ